MWLIMSMKYHFEKLVCLSTSCLIDTPVRDAEGDVDEAVRERPVRRHGHRRDPGAGGAARLQLHVQGADGREQRQPRQADR